jgi:hypothetical protein
MFAMQCKGNEMRLGNTKQTNIFSRSFLRNRKRRRANKKIPETGFLSTGKRLQVEFVNYVIDKMLYDFMKFQR